MAQHASIRLSFLAVLAAASVAVAAGCANNSSDPKTSTVRPRPLSRTAKAKLAKTLIGEIHTVYPSDTGLARIYGQTANLGKTTYRVLEFEIVAQQQQRGSSRDAEKRNVIATFRVQNLRPGEVRPFDVQSTADAGALQEAKVGLRAAAQ